MRKKFRPSLQHLKRGTRHVGRWMWYLSAGLLVAIAVIFTVARVGLPALAAKKTAIENFLTDKTTYPVRIAALETYWDGLRPGLQIKGLEIFSSADLTRAMRLEEIRVSLAVLPLVWGELQINSLVVVKPSLALERLADGRFQITGLQPVQIPVEGGDGKLLKWLLSQRRLAIEDGELQWFDQMGERRGMYLSRINLDLRNKGDRHKLAVTVQLPPDVCAECSLVADITGNPTTKKAWQGRVFVRAVDAALDGLPIVIREMLPPQLAGKFDVQLWTDWHNGKLKSAEGSIKVADLKLPLKNINTPLAIKSASAELTWRRTGKESQLDLEDLLLGLHGSVWSAGHLRITEDPDGSALQIDHINIDDITAFLAAIDREDKFFEILKTVRPGGELHDIKLTIDGDGKRLDDYSLEVKLEDITSEPYKRVPGVRGLSGQLSARRGRGTLLLANQNVTVSAPHVFRVPLNADISGNLSWEIKNEYVEINGDDLRITSEDGKGDGKLTLRIPFNRTIRPYLKLQAKFSDGNGANIKRYYPINLLTQQTVAWLDESIVGGRVTSASVIYDGNLASFPFREGNGTFEVRAHVSDGVFNYLPGWAPITNADVDIQFSGSRMQLNGKQGKIDGLDIEQVVVRAEDLRKSGNSNVEVMVKIVGPLEETSRVVRASPKGKQSDWKSYLDFGLGAQGSGVIDLTLDIPVGNASAFTMIGNYTVEDGSLELGIAKLKGESVNGRIGFDQVGVTEGVLQMRMMGGDATVKITREVNKNRYETTLSGEGKFTANGLAEAFEWPLVPHVKGDADWKGTMRLHRGRRHLELEAGLERMTSAYPAPLHRPDGIPERLILSADYAGQSERNINFRIGNQIDAKLVFAKQDVDWGLARGVVAVGEPASSPRAPGLHVSTSTDHINADAWLRVFGFGSKDTSPMPDYLRRFTGRFNSVQLINRRLGALHIDLMREGQGWTGQLEGDAAEGEMRSVSATRRSNGTIDFDLKHLVVHDKERGTDDEPVDPRTLPTIGLKVGSLRLKGRELGQLDLRAAHTDLGWRIVRCDLTRPEMTLSVKGSWQVFGGRQKTKLELELSSSDMGQTLAAYGSSDQMANGTVYLTSKLSWAGSPASINLSTLSGNVSVSAENGRFLKVKQGAGRLFGLLDLTSVVKFLTLDFGGLFGKGLPFKTLTGEVSIEKGDAYTRNLVLTGSAAQVSVNGRVGLAAEDYDLAVQVTPRLGTNLAVWQLLGPQGAVLLLALEKLLKQQIGKGPRITYLIKGRWNEPVVTRLQEKPGKQGSNAADRR
ncbi:MAG: YhdP family protein [Gammaproteobacteria bacterium]|nr:YhdP family protein [Gammaproteobacteria bacterium]